MVRKRADLQGQNEGNEGPYAPSASRNPGNKPSSVRRAAETAIPRNGAGLKRPGLTQSNRSSGDSSKRLKLASDSKHGLTQSQQDRKFQNSMNRFSGDGARDTLSTSISPPSQHRTGSFISQWRRTPEMRPITSKTSTPCPPRKIGSGPFMIDDSDDSEDDTMPPPSRVPGTPKQSTPLSTPVASDSQRIKAELLRKSARMREEAQAKRQQQPAEKEVKAPSEQFSREPLSSRRGSVSPPPLLRRHAPTAKSRDGLQPHGALRNDSAGVIDLKPHLNALKRDKQPTRTKGIQQQDDDLFGASQSALPRSAKAYDDSSHKNKLEALRRESDEAAKRAELERQRIEKQERADMERKLQLEQERVIKKATELRRRLQAEAEAEAEMAARRVREKQLQESLRRTREAEAEVEAERKAAAAVREVKRQNENKKRAADNPKPSGLDAEQQRQKDERIRKQKERNKRLCDHNDEFQIVIEDDEPPTIAQAPQPIKQPKSLAQAAREARQAGPHTEESRFEDSDNLHAPTRTPFGATSSSFAQPDRPMRQTPGAKSLRPGLSTDKGRPLGDIDSSDCKMVLWRDTENKGMDKIAQMYKDLTGKTRSEDYLKRRIHQVKKAFEIAKVPFHLKQELANGSEDAKAQINAMMLEQSPRPQADFQPRTVESAKPAGRHSSHARVPGDILPEDAKLLEWKDAGDDMGDISSKFERLTGKSRSTETPRKRIRKLKDANASADTSSDLGHSMVREVPGAKEEVNRGALPTRAQAQPPAPFSARRDSPIDDRSRFQDLQPSRQFNNIAEAYAGHEEPERRTTGGKTINANFLWNMAENMGQAWEEAMEEADESDAESEIDPTNPEDYVHYTYVVHRREILYSDSGDDEDAEVSDWEPISKPFENPAKANERVRMELFKSKPVFLDLSHCGLFFGTDDNGMSTCRLVNDEVGEVEVGIKRYEHKFTDKRLPESKEGWISKYWYSVMERQIITARTTSTEQYVEPVADDLFGEQPEEAVQKERVVHKEREHYKEVMRPNTMTTSLEHANKLATAYFAKITITQGVNLSSTDRQRREKAEALFNALAEGETFGKQEIDVDGNVFRVWVEKNTMSGARNI